MGATLYLIDANADKRVESLREVNGRIEDLEMVLYNTGSTRREELLRIGEGLASWQDVDLRNVESVQLWSEEENVNCRGMMPTKAYHYHSISFTPCNYMEPSR